MLTTFLIGTFFVSALTVLKTVFGTLCFTSSMYDDDYIRDCQDEFGENSLLEGDIFKYEKTKIYLLNKLAS